MCSSDLIADRVTPTLLLDALNDYFEKIVGEIHKEEGMVAKFRGDGIFAMWNAPFDQQDFRRRALKSALRLKESVGEFHSDDLGLPLQTRIGLHCGDAAIGNCGGRERFEYTAIGVNVNIAARPEAANERLGTQLLVSHDAIEGMESELVLREIGYCHLKGVGSLKRIFEALAWSNGEARPAWLNEFDEGRRHFRSRDFSRAAESFRRALELKPKDGPSEFFCELAEAFAKNPPPADWNGEIDLA